MRERGPKFGQGCPDRMFERHASLLSIQEKEKKKCKQLVVELVSAAYYCWDEIRLFASSTSDGLSHD
jgi:hypothetical protein